MSIYTWAIRKHVQTLGVAFSIFSPKAWVVTTLAAAIAPAVIGLTTAIFGNWFFVRMTPVRPQDYFIWVVSSVLIGLTVGSYFAGGSKVGEENFYRAECCRFSLWAAPSVINLWSCFWALPEP